MANSTSPPLLAAPDLLARVAQLELRARSVVEGALAGMHRSPHRGSSVEFAQHRDYVQGDEIRHIDWKVYSRTDRYHVKQYEEETNLRATLAVDVSASMNYRGASSTATKREFGITLAIALSYLLTRQRDMVGLATFDAGISRFVPPAGTAAHLRQIAEILAAEPARQRTGIADTFHALADRLKRRGMVVVISDLLDDASSVLRGLQHLRHRRHDVLLLHVLDNDEITFPFSESMVFEGMEGEPPLHIEPRAMRAEYLRAFDAYRQELRGGCRERGVDYHLFNTSDPLESALPQFLASRQGKSGR